MKNMLLTSAALIAMISQAEAQEAGYNWSGFYVGAQAGYGWSTAEFNGSAGGLPIPGSLIPDSDHHEDGFVGGIHAGYDWRQGNVVFGALADVDFMDVDQVQLAGIAVLNPADPFVGKEEAYSYDIDWLATARARVGYLPTERLLVYGTGGLAVAHVEVTGEQGFVTDLPIPPLTNSFSDSSIEIGGVIGLGAEFAVARNWTVKTEYLHYDFNSVTLGGGIEGDGPSFDPSVDTVKVGISYRFGS
jgi:outer membrane immunogenic protein